MIKFSKKYKPLLYELLIEDKHKEVDIVLLTGGRSSAKSFVVALFSLIGLVEKAWNILYTRFTNVSILESIKPEVDGKIELLNYQNKVNNTANRIEYNGNRIAFKGIKTGSKQQTANLKSLSGFNIFVVDEAEEIPDYETFEKVFLSIRSNEKRNITLLLLNPASIHHWIYREFFRKRKVEAGSNLVKGNIMYIHTSYLDVPKEYLANNIVKYYEQLKENDPKRYEQIVLGGWTDNSEINIYKNWKYIDENIKFEDLPYPSYYGLDFGSANPTALVEIKYDGEKSIFIKERFYKPRNETTNALGIEFEKLNISKKVPISCDYAEPESIRDLTIYNFLAIKCPTKDVKLHIEDIQKLNVFITHDSQNIWNEYEEYKWEIVKDVNLDRPIKVNDHAMDAIRYGVSYIKSWVGLKV